MRGNAEFVFFFFFVNFLIFLRDILDYFNIE